MAACEVIAYGPDEWDIIPGSGSNFSLRRNVQSDSWGPLIQ